jgi:hypothetical protein
MPRSITADFNFPKWNYYGRGNGENGHHHHRRSVERSLLGGPIQSPRQAVATVPSLIHLLGGKLRLS